MTEPKSLKDYNTELDALLDRLGKDRIKEDAAHSERASYYARRAAIYREVAALFKAVKDSNLASDLVTGYGFAHAQEYYEDWAKKYDGYAARAEARARQDGGE